MIPTYNFPAKEQSLSSTIYLKKKKPLGNQTKNHPTVHPNRINLD